VELLYIQILVEILRSLHNYHQLSRGHTVVPLGLEQSFAEIGHNPLASVSYSGHYSTNCHVAGVGVDDLLTWSRVTQIGAAQSAPLCGFKAVSAAGDH